MEPRIIGYELNFMDAIGRLVEIKVSSDTACIWYKGGDNRTTEITVTREIWDQLVRAAHALQFPDESK